MARFGLSDKEWVLIRPLLPIKPRGVARADDRRAINAIFFILRTGSPWRDLPERYGPYTTAYNRYNRWAKVGVWVRIFEMLAAKSPHTMALIDSSIIRAHQHAAGAKAHIPSTRSRLIQRSVSRRIYRERNLVERFFNKLKHFRRVATRFDKLARNFLAAAALASARLWMRAYESTT